MTASSLAGIITAVATVLTAVAILIGAVTVLIPLLRRTRETQETVRAVHRDVTEVHVMVNQRLTDATRYNERLAEELAAHGIPVPRDTSLRAPDGSPAA